MDNKIIGLFLAALTFATTASPAAVPERYPLHWAAKTGDAKEIERLLTEKICSVNDRNDYGGTALHYAAGNGKVDCVNVLLENGAGVNAVTTSDETPLHWAAYYGHADCINVLLTGGAIIDTQDNTGYAPIHKAATAGKVDAVNTLVARGANVNDRTKGGHWTPLHCAAANGRIDCAKRLLELGAKVDVKDIDGMTPVMQAEERRYKELAKYLRTKQAQ